MARAAGKMASQASEQRVIAGAAKHVAPTIVGERIISGPALNGWDREGGKRIRNIVKHVIVARADKFLYGTIGYEIAFREQANRSVKTGVLQIE